jgi:hypothetical protein
VVVGATTGAVIVLVLVLLMGCNYQDKSKLGNFRSIKIDTTFEKMPFTFIPLQLYGHPDSILCYGIIVWSTNAGRSWRLDTSRYPFDLQPPHKKIDEMPNYDESDEYLNPNIYLSTLLHYENTISILN